TQAWHRNGLPAPEAGDVAWLVTTVSAAADRVESGNLPWGTHLISLSNAMSALAADFPEHGQSIARSAARLLDRLTQHGVTAGAGGLAEFMYGLDKLGDCPAAAEFIQASLSHLERSYRILGRQASIMLYGVRKQSNSGDIESLIKILAGKIDVQDNMEVKYLAKLALSLQDRPLSIGKLKWQTMLSKQLFNARPTFYIDIIKILMGCVPPAPATLPAQTRALLRSLANCLPSDGPESGELACRMLAEATLLLAPHLADEDAHALLRKIAVKIGMPEHAAEFATATAVDGPQLVYRMLGGDSLFDTGLDLHNCSAQLASTLVEQCLAKMDHDKSSLKIITGTGRTHPGKEGKMLALVKQVAQRHPVRVVDDRWSAAVVELRFHPWPSSSGQHGARRLAQKRKAQDHERPDAVKKPRLSPELEQRNIAPEYGLDSAQQVDLQWVATDLADGYLPSDNVWSDEEETEVAVNLKDGLAR
ncbi:MAG TPA: hypothetical protein VF797_02355, partial [Noviherbaspirillum sp.]